MNITRRVLFALFAAPLARPIRKHHDEIQVRITGDASDTDTLRAFDQVDKIIAAKTPEEALAAYESLYARIGGISFGEIREVTDIRIDGIPVTSEHLGNGVVRYKSPA